MSSRTRTYLTPPRLASLPAAREQLEYSSRSLVFVEDGRRLLRAWGTPEHPWALAVTPQGTRWQVEAWGVDPPVARAAARALFSLDHPLEEFYRRVRAEPTLAGTERRFRGLRLPRDATVYESLLYAVIGQQLSVRAALTILGRVLHRTQSFLTVDGVEVPTAPSPAALRSLGARGLRDAGLSRVKVRAIRELAEERARRTVDDPSLATDPLAGAVGRLLALHGVGPWTAENSLLRGTGRRDVFVGGDLGIRVALDRYGVLPRSAPEPRAREWAERWYPGWGSYATLYLWRRLVADRPA